MVRTILSSPPEIDNLSALSATLEADTPIVASKEGKESVVEDALVVIPAAGGCAGSLRVLSDFPLRTKNFEISMELKMGDFLF